MMMLQDILDYPSPNQNNKKLPAVVMIRENREINEHIKESANILAQRGYIVLGVDLFQGEIATDQTRARKLTSIFRYNPNIAIGNMKSAVCYLGSLEDVNASRMTSFEWYFWGQQSLQLAINSKDYPLALTIIYYGRSTNYTQALSNTVACFRIFGEDQSIPVTSVRKFEQNLNELGIPNEIHANGIHVYLGMGHAFENPSNDNYAHEKPPMLGERHDFLKRNV